MLRQILEKKGQPAKKWEDAIKKTKLKNLVMVEKPQKKDADGCYYWVTFKIDTAKELETLGKGIQELNNILDFDELNDCDEMVDSASFEFLDNDKIKVWFWSACDCD